MNLLRRILGILFSIYAILIFLVLMFLVFPLVVIASFLGKVRGGNIIYSLCRFWADAAMFCWGMRQQNIYEAPVNKDHAVIYVFNHISYMDIPIILKVFRGKIRILGKSEMARVPVFGFIYRKAVVMVDRENDAARAKSVQELKKVLRKNISVVIAPEGTFNMTGKPLKEFYNGAFRIAADTETAVQPVLFLDADRRMNYRSIFSFTPGRSRAVFLAEEKGTDANELKERVYRSMESGLIRYGASWITNRLQMTDNS